LGANDDTRCQVFCPVYHEKVLFTLEKRTVSITYERGTLARLSAGVEAAIEKGLLQEKELVDDPQHKH